MKKLQVVVVGSAADLDLSERCKQLAYEVGRELGRKGIVTCYGGEKDVSSLSTIAGEGAKCGGGLVVAVTYGTDKLLFDTTAGYYKNPWEPDIIVPAGMSRGGGREYLLGLVGDAIISISGGSGTGNELLVAYQNNRPLIGLEGTEGFTEMFLDGQDRRLSDFAFGSYQEAQIAALERSGVKFSIGRPFDSRRIPMIGVQTPQDAVKLAEVLGTVYLEKIECSCSLTR